MTLTFNSPRGDKSLELRQVESLETIASHLADMADALGKSADILAGAEAQEASNE